MLFSAGAAEKAKYHAKIKFINEHFRMQDPFVKETTLDGDLLDAVQWGAEQSDEQVLRLRVEFLIVSLRCLLFLSGDGRVGAYYVRH